MNSFVVWIDVTRSKANEKANFLSSHKAHECQYKILENLFKEKWEKFITNKRNVFINIY